VTLLLLSLACRSEPPPTGTVDDTGICDDALVGDLDVVPLADHRRAWVQGDDHEDHLGTAVACAARSDGLDTPLWVAGGPGLDGGAVIAFEGLGTGELTEADARFVLRGDLEERDDVGQTVHIDAEAGWVWAGSPGSFRHERSAGGIWGVQIATAGSEITHGDLDAYVVGDGRGAYAYRGLPLGDLDGDGQTELMVGHTYWSALATAEGFLALYSGDVLDGEVFVDDAAHTFVDPGNINHEGDQLGAADVDGDGHIDVIHGEPLTEGDGHGRVAIRLGPLLGGSTAKDLQADIELTGTEGGVFGTYGSTGDLNGDGAVDLVFADLLAEVDGLDHAGTVYVFFGPFVPGTSISADDADLIVEGYAFYGHLAASVVADHDGDGFDDLIVAHTPEPETDDCAARLHVFRGPVPVGRVSALTADLTYAHDEVHTQLGSALAACDLDGDGDDELVVGERFYGTDDVPGQGRVHVIDGWAF